MQLVRTIFPLFQNCFNFFFQTPPKPYSFNYEVTDEHGNVHYRREQGDPAGIVTGSYGYMNVNGLYRSVEYMASAEGFRAKVKTNEPGAKGPGSADVELQADPVPPGLAEMFDRKAPTVPQAMPSPASRPSYPGMKG